MIQIFILGASSAYGVGGEKCGWGDLVKQYVHSLMYSEGGVGEKYEVFNFAKPGATINFVLDTFPGQLQQYGRGGKVTTIISVGGNNYVAREEPNNFVSTPEEFTEQMTELLALLKENSDQVVFVGSGYVDEARTNPKPNPLTGGKTYITNARRQQFSNITKQICELNNIDYVGVEVGQEEWLQSYLYDDGLHPNQKGYQLIFELIKNRLSLPLENP